MIFLTVGTQLPFDRLVKIVLEWCEDNGVEYIFQVGKSFLEADNVKVFEYLSEAQFNKYFKESELVVSHAGMGTILNCLYECKPLIVMPRKFSLNEHRNDHQVATVEGLSNILDGISCESEHDLLKVLNKGDFVYPNSDSENLALFAENIKKEIF